MVRVELAGILTELLIVQVAMEEVSWSNTQLESVTVVDPKAAPETI